VSSCWQEGEGSRRMLSPLAVETESATGAPDRPELEVSQEVEERFGGGDVGSMGGSGKWLSERGGSRRWHRRIRKENSERGQFRRVGGRRGDVNERLDRSKERISVRSEAR
jgi:hypothetical protein